MDAPGRVLAGDVQDLPNYLTQGGELAGVARGPVAGAVDVVGQVVVALVGEPCPAVTGLVGGEGNGGRLVGRVVRQGRVAAHGGDRDGGRLDVGAVPDELSTRHQRCYDVHGTITVEVRGTNPVRYGGLRVHGVSVPGRARTGVLVPDDPVTGTVRDHEVHVTITIQIDSEAGVRLGEGGVDGVSCPARGGLLEPRHLLGVLGNGGHVHVTVVVDVRWEDPLGAGVARGDCVLGPTVADVLEPRHLVAAVRHRDHVSLIIPVHVHGTGFESEGESHGDRVFGPAAARVLEPRDLPRTRIDADHVLITVAVHVRHGHTAGIERRTDRHLAPARAVARSVVPPGQTVVRTTGTGDHVHVPVTVHVRHIQSDGAGVARGDYVLGPTAPCVLEPRHLVPVVVGTEHVEVAVAVHVSCVHRAPLIGVLVDHRLRPRQVDGVGQIDVGGSRLLVGDCVGVVAACDVHHLGSAVDQFGGCTGYRPRPVPFAVVGHVGVCLVGQRPPAVAVLVKREGDGGIVDRVREARRLRPHGLDGQRRVDLRGEVGVLR